MTIDIDILVEDGSTDMTSYVISYTRVNDLCTGIGTLELEVDPTYTSLIQGSVVTLTEEGNKIGEFYVATKQRTVTSSDSYSCQDNSKWLEDYFIPVLRSTQGGSSRYWIQLILGEAQISSNFTTASDGYLLPEDDQIGLEPGYQVVMRLCQQSGWYFYFDANGVCQVGEISTNWHNPSYTLATTDGKMLQEELVSEDGQLRNKVVVWGGAIDFSENLMYTSLEVSTPWDRDADDKRTIVYSNNYIRDFATAWRFGKQLLDEYSKTVSLKTYTLAGYVDLTVGDVAYCDTIIYDGVGRVSVVQSNMTSDRGFRTTIVIDKRCPRIFAYWSSDAEYVYAGTQGSGVWRKPFDTNAWENYSTGLTELDINDLKINSGFFVCTGANGKAFTRKIIDSAWTPFAPTGFVDADTETTYLYTELETAGVGLDHTTNTCYIGYHHKEDKRSWVVELLPDKTYSIHQVFTENTLISPNYDYFLYDTDHTDTTVILSAQTEQSVPPYYAQVRAMWDDTDGDSVNRASPASLTDVRSLTLLDPDSPTVMTQRRSVGPADRVVGAAIISESDGEAYFLNRDGFNVIELDSPYTHTAYAFSFVLPGVFSSSRGSVYRSSASTFEILVAGGPSGIYPQVAHYQHNTGSGTTTLIWESTDDPLTYLSAFSVAVFGSVIFYAWRTTTTGLLKMGYYNASGGANVLASVEVGIPTTGWGGAASVGITPITFDNDYACVAATCVVRDDVFTSIGRTAKLSTIAFPLAGGDVITSTSEIFSDDTYEQVPLSFTAYVDQVCTKKMANIAYGMVRFAAKEVVGGTDTLVQKSYTFNMRTGLSIFDLYEDTTTDIGYTSDSNYSGMFDWSTGQGLVVAPMNGRSYARGLVYNSAGAGTKTFALDPATGAETMWAISVTFGILHSNQIDDYDGTIFLSNVGRNHVTGAADKTYSGITGGYSDVFVASGRLFYWDYGGTGLIRMYSSSMTDFPDVLPPADPTIYPWPVAISASPTPSGTGYAFEEEIAFNTEGLQVEISRNNPIIYFGGEIPEDDRGDGVLYFSSTGVSGDIHKFSDFISISESMGFVTDVRTVELLGAQSNSSGLVLLDESDFARYVLASQPSGQNTGHSWDYPLGFMYYHDAFTISNPWLAFGQLSGSIHRLETTNYFTDPWVFASISGTTSKFYQMESGSVDFIEHSNNLPASNILVIRADDRI